MLIQFTNETSRATVGGNQPPGSHMRGDGGNTPRNSIQLRAVKPPRLLVPVAPSRVEETTVHSFLSRCGAALRDVAAITAAVLLICATGVGITVAIYFLLFCKF